MARPSSTTPTERELDILRVLWSAGTASLSQIAAELHAQRGVATTTVATILKVMVGKGLVRRTEDRRWEATISRDETGQGIVSQLLDRVFAGSAQQMVSHVLSAGRPSEDELRELRKMLDDYQSSTRPQSEK